MREFVAIVHKDAGSDFGVVFPDFPGCVTAGATMDEAKTLAHEALEGHIEVTLEYGETIPEPMKIEDAVSDDLATNAYAFFFVRV